MLWMICSEPDTGDVQKWDTTHDEKTLKALKTLFEMECVQSGSCGS